MELAQTIMLPQPNFKAVSRVEWTCEGGCGQSFDLPADMMEREKGYHRLCTPSAAAYEMAYDAWDEFTVALTVAIMAKEAKEAKGR